MWVIAILVAVASAGAPPPELLEDVAQVLGASFFDAEFRRQRLPELVRRQRARVAGGEDPRDAVQELLEDIPVSHLALLSRRTHDALIAELRSARRPTVGFQLVERGGGYFVDWLLEGGPGERAGLQRGDEVLALDGVPVAESPRVDWRSDDAALPDPPLHLVTARAGEEVEVRVRRRAGAEAASARVDVAPYSAFDATLASARVVDTGGVPLAYLHLWYVHLDRLSELVEDALRGPFAGCEGLVLDLRGRGGSADEARRLAQLLDARRGIWRRPVVLLVDADTRSAKEVLAYELRRRQSALIVGEPTCGAVIPASFERVGTDAVLMYPASTLGRYTRLLEGVGVAPDVPVADAGAFAEGADPILEAGFLAARAWCRAARR